MSLDTSQKTASASPIVVGIADIKICQDPDGVLVTYALGSCIAVCIYDHKLKTAGMIHYMLPQAKLSADKAEANPAMFADTGIPLLFHKMFEAGSHMENLVVKMAGGSTLNSDKTTFKIGRRNQLMVRKLMWKNEIVISAEDVGGTVSRSVWFHARNGQMIVSSDGMEKSL